MKYSEGYLLDGRYRLERFIGSGTFGEVWVAVDAATDIEVAIKVYVSMDEKGLKEFKDEFKISFELNHTNLLHANYLGVNAEDQRPYLVMPFCPDGSVSKYAGEMSETDLWRFIRDVASGLAYLHSMQPPIIHQDIKPDNILILKSGDFVITDFGISKQLRATLRKTANAMSSAGAISYMGPERFSKQYHAVKASDIWSLGASIFELVTNELPFCGMGGSLLKQGADMPELPEGYSDTLNIVCQACMAKEPWSRPTAQQLADFASRILEGEASPRMPWIKDGSAPVQEEKKPGKPDAQEKEEKPVRKPLTKTIAFTDTSSVRNNDTQPDADSAKKDDATVDVNSSDSGIGHGHTVRDFSDVPPSEAKKPVSPWVWVLSAVAGLAVGVVLNLFV